MPAGGMIDPDNFPIPTLMPARLEFRAGRLRANAVLLAESGHDVKSAWAGLAACYSAPESETLLSVVDPVPADGDTVESGMDRAATALEDFAEEVRGIKERWTTLTADANAFLASIEGDDDWRKPDTWSGEWWTGGESPKVAEHQALLDRADALRREYEAAEVVCANAINADLPVRTKFVHGDSGTEPAVMQYAHGYDEYLGDMEMPWGGPVGTDHAWFIDVKDSVSDFAVGALEDFGGAVGIHSSEGWFEMGWGDALAEYHGENLETLGAMAGLYDPQSGEWGEVDWETFGETWIEVAHAVVPWREWDERPGYVIGTAVLNIGSMVAGTVLTATGVGAVVGVPLLLWRGSAILGKVDLPDVADVDVPSNGIDIELRLNLPFYGNVGGPLAGFHLDLPGLSNSLSPSETAALTAALDRLADGSEGSPADPDSPHDPTVQDLDDALTVEDVLDPTSAESTRLREEYEGDFLENDVRSDGTEPSWEASEAGRGSEGDDLDGADSARVPALVGPRSDTAEGAESPALTPDRPVDLTGDGDLDAPADRGDGAPGDRIPEVTNSVGDDVRPVDTPPNDGGTGFHHDGTGAWSDGHRGGSTGDGSDHLPSPSPTEVWDGSGDIPGEMGADGIRRFDDNGEEYGERFLEDPDFNPHTFDRLPYEQQRAVLGYTRFSWLNGVMRADTIGEGLMALREKANKENMELGFRSPSLGWALYELNDLRRPTPADLTDLRRRAEAGEIQPTPLQWELLDGFRNSSDPVSWLGRLLRERPGAPGRIAEQFRGSAFPDVEDVTARVRDLDAALDRPLPEGIEVVRGLHDIGQLNEFARVDAAYLPSLVGTVQSDNGYMSTAIGRDPITVDGKPFEYTLLLDVPQGAHGLWVGRNSAYPDQREIIFPRETKFQILDVRVEGDMTYISARVLVDGK